MYPHEAGPEPCTRQALKAAFLSRGAVSRGLCERGSRSPSLCSSTGFFFPSKLTLIHHLSYDHKRA